MKKHVFFWIVGIHLAISACAASSFEDPSHIDQKSKNALFEGFENAFSEILPLKQARVDIFNEGIKNFEHRKNSVRIMRSADGQYQAHTLYRIEKFEGQLMVKIFHCGYQDKTQAQSWFKELFGSLRKEYAHPLICFYVDNDANQFWKELLQNSGFAAETELSLDSNYSDCIAFVKRDN